MTSRSVATAERRHEKTADNSGVEAAIGRYARSDRNRHRKRQCHDGDGETGNGVGLEVRDAVALAELGDELGHEQLGEGGRSCSCRHISCVLDAFRSGTAVPGSGTLNRPLRQPSWLTVPSLINSTRRIELSTTFVSVSTTLQHVAFVRFRWMIGSNTPDASRAGVGPAQTNVRRATAGR